jgi:hypothetical protein
MNVTKFTDLLQRGCLYFASPAQFESNDPLEGRLPKSHEDAEQAMAHGIFAPMAALRPHFSTSPDMLAAFDRVMANAEPDVAITRKQAALRFVISCWHKSPSQSEWMWDNYAEGTGVAIESTEQQLTDSLSGTSGILISDVRYADYDNDAIERGHRQYGLFMKRNSFSAEKELRVTLLRPESEWETDAAKEGIRVPCNLGTLITAIHVKPASETHVRAIIAKFSGTRPDLLAKPVVVSAGR